MDDGACVARAGIADTRNPIAGNSSNRVMASVTLELEDDMHPYLSHRNYLRHRMPDAAMRHRTETESAGFFRRWIGAAVRKWKRRKMIAALEAMNDRMLRDIGIYRGDIKRVVDGFDDRELGMVPMASARPAAGNDHNVFQKAA